MFPLNTCLAAAQVLSRRRHSGQHAAFPLECREPTGRKIPQLDGRREVARQGGPYEELCRRAVPDQLRHHGQTAERLRLRLAACEWNVNGSHLARDEQAEFVV